MYLSATKTVQSHFRVFVKIHPWLNFQLCRKMTALNQMSYYEGMSDFGQKCSHSSGDEFTLSHKIRSN